MRLGQKLIIDGNGTEKQIFSAMADSVQSRATGAQLDYGSSMGVIAFMQSAVAASGNIPGVPAWWTKARDIALTRLLPTLDIIPGVVAGEANTIAEMGWRWADGMPKNWARYYDNVFINAGWGEGWQVTIAKGVNDYTCTDNGWFTEKIGDGDDKLEEIYNRKTGEKMGVVFTKGPLQSEVKGIAHIDSLRCTRTGNPEWPVEYEDLDGLITRFHRTRIAFAADMPSPRETMRGVGLCALSRCLRRAAYIQAVGTYEYERLAGRDLNKLHLIQGISSGEIVDGILDAQDRFDAQGYERYAPGAIIARDVPPMPGGLGDLNAISLEMGGLVEGYSEEEATRVAVMAIALAFGIDVRTIWATVTSGATKADAEVGYVVKRNRGTGARVKLIERIVNYNILPARFAGMWTLDYTDEFEQEQGLRRQQVQIDIIDKLWSKGSGILASLPFQTAVQEAVSRGVLSDDALEAALMIEAEEPTPEEDITEELDMSEETELEDETEAEEETIEGAKQTGDPPAYTLETLGAPLPVYTDDDTLISTRDIDRELERWRRIPELAPYAPKSSRGIAAQKARRLRLPSFKQEEIPVVTIPEAVRPALSDIRAATAREETAALCGRLARGEISLSEWQAEARNIIKDLHTAQMAIGKGGWPFVDQTDWGRVGAALRSQYAYLDSFARDILNAGIEGTFYSEAYLANRLGMYVDSGTASYNRGLYASQGFNPSSLPAVPGDGSTQCRTRCKCRWDFDEIDNGLYNAIWLLGDADHCPDCVARADEWAPWGVVTKEGMQ